MPQEDETALKTFLGGLYRLAVEGDIPQKEAAAELIPYIQQAWILAQRYDAVVANPPYMGGKGMNGELKEFAKKQFPDSKSDLFAMFIERGFSWLKDAAYNSMVTMQSWMFLSSYENMRANILDKYTIETMVHMGNGVMKIAFGTNATVFRNVHIPSYQGAFSYTENDDINDEGYPKEFPVKNDRLKTAAADDFQKIPGAPIAYWLSESEVNLFDNKKISQIASTRLGMATADNERFLRFWHEVNFANIGFDFTDRIQAKKSGLKWFPYQKGGEYRKWYGNLDYVVNWFDDGREIQNFTDEKSGKVRSHNYNLDFIFKKGITWNALSSSKTSARVSESSLFDNAGSSLFVNNEDLYLPVLAFINSDIIISLIKAISPTLNYQPGDISKLPAFFDEKMIESLSLNTAELISLAKENWSQQENSYQFSFNQDAFQNGSLVNILKNQTEVFYQKLIKTHELECDNNKIFYEKCNILNENNLALAEITLENNVFQSLSSISKDEYNQFKAIQVINSLSLAIGCMMGRYSLDREGLVYAHEGNKGFSELVDEGAYQTFPADEDGILPLMDSDWFDDDVTSRVKEFVRTVWGEEHLQENLDFIAESLCLYAIKPKKGESSLDTIRRYLSTQFWKDHMKMYKKRPIYWLFSSGKEKAFECLVYLHRYNEGTLSRMRTEYVVPLLARYQGNIDLVNDQLKNAESGAATTRLKKELDGLTKKFNELRNFDDRLRHYADRRITIDLDDGVKVNYGKFGDLLADVKAITGSAPQEA